MKKYADITIAHYTINWAKEGLTWPEISQRWKEKGSSRTSKSAIQPIIKAHYKRPENYKRFLAMMRQNAERARNAANQAIGITSEVQEVILCETGALMLMGAKGIMEESLPMFMPSFCFWELNRIAKHSNEAADVLSYMYSVPERIDFIRIERADETLFVEPDEVIKYRTYGIVAVACELVSRGFRVRLITNSMDVERTALLQNSAELEVVRLRR